MYAIRSYYGIYDAYTTSSNFPYSKPAADFNYIRNSVKIVIDAYNGETNFYLFNADKDPMVRVYRRIFPVITSYSIHYTKLYEG